MEARPENQSERTEARILVIEDDANTRAFLRRGLEEAGHSVIAAESAETGLNLGRKEKFDLVILDIMLPDGNGLEICRSIREANTQIPVLFLTAMGTPENIAIGLDTGADDYLVKPFKFIELLARIRTLLRRTRRAPSVTAPAQLFSFAGVTLDDYSKIVKRGDKTLNLTSTEFKLLHMFLKSPGKVIARTEILEEIWGTDVYIGSNVVDVYINYLRKKLESGGYPRLLHTVIGMGYVLKDSYEN